MEHLGAGSPIDEVAKFAPDDGLLVDLLGEIAPADPQREALPVGNSQRCYGFKK